MPTIQPLQVPDHLITRIRKGEKSRELYEIVYLSDLRPNRHDIDEILLISVTVRMWAQDTRDAIQQLDSYPPTTMVERDEHALPVLVLVSVGPVSGNSGGGIDEDSMLVIGTPM